MKTSKPSTITLSVKNRGIVVFAEGYTDLFFYRRLLQIMKDSSSNSFSPAKVENVEGIGNFINYPYNHMKNFMIPNNKGTVFDVFLCYDTDVYDLQTKPVFEWPQVMKKLNTLRSVDRITRITQEKSIEDWILKDQLGVLGYLGLDKTTKIQNGKGIDTLKALYRKANRVYVHGAQKDSQSLIYALDFEVIIHKLWIELQPFFSLYDISQVNRLHVNR